MAIFGKQTNQSRVYCLMASALTWVTNVGFESIRERKEASAGGTVFPSPGGPLSPTVTSEKIRCWVGERKLVHVRDNGAQSVESVKDTMRSMISGGQPKKGMLLVFGLG